MTASKQQQAIAKLEKTVEVNSIAKMATLPPVQQALAMSKGLKDVAAALDPLMDEFLPLAGSALGFKLDKQYGKPEIRGAMVEATMRGLPLMGNCFNVISGRCYVTREGYEFLVRNHPGVTNLRWAVTEPEEIKAVAGSKDAAAHMPFEAGWDLDGQPQTLAGKYYVRMYAGNSSMYDGLVGKATRRGLAKVYEALVGAVLCPPDADTPNGVVVVDAEVITPAKDEAKDLSEELVADLSGRIDLTTSKSELAKISEEIGKLKDADELAPTSLKKLGQAYTAKLKEIESGKAS